jgi:hypothetical protein
MAGQCARADGAVKAPAPGAGRRGLKSPAQQLLDAVFEGHGVAVERREDAGMPLRDRLVHAAPARDQPGAGLLELGPGRHRELAQLRNGPLARLDQIILRLRPRRLESREHVGPSSRGRLVGASARLIDGADEGRKNLLHPGLEVVLDRRRPGVHLLHRLRRPALGRAQLLECRDQLVILRPGPREVLRQLLLNCREIHARFVEHALQRRDLEVERIHPLALPLQSRGQALTLALQPERQLRRLCLDRREPPRHRPDLLLGVAELGGDPADAVIEPGEPRGRARKARLDLVEVAGGGRGAGAQLTQRRREVAVRGGLRPGAAAAADRRERAHRFAHDLTELADTCLQLRLQARDLLPDAVDRAEARLERGAAVGDLLAQTLLEGGELALRLLNQPIALVRGSAEHHAAE